MSKEYIDDEFGKFAEMTNDSRHPELFPEADVILLGVSGAGKTTLCKELAKRGVKAANIPVIFDYEIEQAILRNREERKRQDEYKQLLKKFVEVGKPIVVYLFCRADEVIWRRHYTEKYNESFRHLYSLSYPADRGAVEERRILGDLRKGASLRDYLKCASLDITLLSPQEAAESIIKLIHAPKPAELKKTQKKHQEYTP
jgi:hypothetical protein